MGIEKISQRKTSQSIKKMTREYYKWQYLAAKDIGHMPTNASSTNLLNNQIN